jgi:hypothetical protein
MLLLTLSSCHLLPCAFSSDRLRYWRGHTVIAEESVAIIDTVSAAGSRLNVAAWASPIFVLLWNTGFVGAKFGLPYAEPFTLLIGLALALRAEHSADERSKADSTRSWPSRPRTA